MGSFTSVVPCPPRCDLCGAAELVIMIVAELISSLGLLDPDGSDSHWPPPFGILRSRLLARQHQLKPLPTEEEYAQGELERMRDDYDVGEGEDPDDLYVQ